MNNLKAAPGAHPHQPRLACNHAQDVNTQENLSLNQKQPFYELKSIRRAYRSGVDTLIIMTVD